MNKDKKVIYSVSLIIFAVLLAILFIKTKESRIVTALAMIPLTAITVIAVRKRTSLSIRKREVLLLVSVLSVIYVALKEMSGVYFKFYINPYYVNKEMLIRFLIPSAIIIIGIEIIRSVLLAQKNLCVDIVTFLACIIADVLIYSNISGITSFNRFMDLFGMTLFPAITANVYYHYISRRYGALPNIAFRAITTLYIYFVKTTTAMSDALASCLKIILPLIMLAFVAALFSKTQKKAIKKKQKGGKVLTVLTLVFMVAVAMLVSCQFRFGALVIATESMTGEINKGDMIIYERYDGQKIQEGQVIVFLQNDAKIVHRVVKVENINGQVRYYTKGDANEDLDPGFITDASIVGLTNVKVPFVGNMTLWLRELIKN